MCLDRGATKWNQVEPRQDPSHFAWISGTSLFYNQVEPSGTKWNRIRNRAALLGFLRRHFFTTKWIQVDPSQDPSCLLGFLAKTISALTLIIILIKSQDSRIQGPQNEINGRILMSTKIRSEYRTGLSQTCAKWCFWFFWGMLVGPVFQTGRSCKKPRVENGTNFWHTALW